MTKQAQKRGELLEDVEEWLVGAEFFGWVRAVEIGGQLFVSMKWKSGGKKARTVLVSPIVTELRPFIEPREKVTA